MFYWEKSPIVTIITEKSYRELLQQNQVHPDGGETISREIGSMTGPVADLSPEEIGLTLAEGHELVRDIERRMISDRYGVSQSKGADTFFDRYKIFFIVGLLNVTAVAAGFGLGRIGRSAYKTQNRLTPTAKRTCLRSTPNT